MENCKICEGMNTVEDSGILWPSPSVVVSLGQDFLATILLLMAVTSIALHSGTMRGSIRVADEGFTRVIVQDGKTNLVSPTFTAVSDSRTVIETRTNLRVASVKAGRKPVLVAPPHYGRFAYASLNRKNGVAKRPEPLSR